MSAGHLVQVVTVTPNPALDHTAWVPGFRPGEVNRVVRDHLVPGGKGVNVAAFLAGWGTHCVATGFLGSENDDLFQAFLDARGIEDRFVSVPGVTRNGVKVVDEEAGTTTDLNFPGFAVGPGHVSSLESVLAEVSAPGRWVVLAGSLPVGAPPGLHRALAEVVRGRGGLVALDTSGDALTAAVEGPVDLVKPNREELEGLTGRTLRDRADVVAAARALADRGITTVVVSLGAEGAVFVRGGEVVFATPPAVAVASTVGAGDAMVAGTVAATVEGRALADVAALATAFSAEALSHVGARLDPDAVRAWVRHTKVERLP